MTGLSNPMVIRTAAAVCVSGFACLVAVALVRRVRQALVHDELAENARPEPEQLPLHAFNAVIQQLKQQKHELVSAQQAERRRAKTSENISAAVLSRLPNGVMFFASNGLVRQANTAARQILGFASLAGMAADKIFREASLANGAGNSVSLADALKVSLRDGVPAQFSGASYTTPSGELRTLEITVTPVQAGTGEMLGAACLITDKTQIAEFQQERQLRGELSAEMALALRTSVAAISGYARQLTERGGHEQTQRLAEDIIFEAAQLDHTIGGFLAGHSAGSRAAQA